METQWIVFLIFSILPASVWLAPPQIKGIYSKGDIMLGGVFPVHAHGSRQKACGSINRERGIQRLEAMRFAIDQVNKNDKLLHGIVLGMNILDTCSDATYSLDRSIEFVMSTLAASQSDRCRGNSSDSRKTIAAVIGGAYSTVSIQIANLLRLFEIPQVSYASTSAELSDKERYGFFMRTVPPDTLQAKALVDIVKYFNWTFVSTVASDDNYGASGIESFIKQYEVTGRCIATKIKIPKSVNESHFREVVKELYRWKDTTLMRVVVLFVGQDHATGILQAATSLKYYNDFIWIASDGWGTVTKPVQGNELVASGALTVTLQSKSISDFDTYFNSLTPSNNKDNIWFNEYWEKTHNCTVSHDHRETRAVASEPYEADAQKNSHKICTGKERDKYYKQESKVQFVYDAVYAVVYGLDRLYKEVCGVNATKLCEEMNLNSSMRTVLQQYITQNKENDPYGNAVQFDENGDSLGFYSIMNYRKVNGLYVYVKVGSWENNNLTLRTQDIEWPEPRMPAEKAPDSICSLECMPGQRKDMTYGKTCCWKCSDCNKNEFLHDEFTCEACPAGFWPLANKTSCYELPVVYIPLNSTSGILPSIFSSIGLVTTIFTAIVFIKHAETPVVKAAGRELSFLLLVGCGVCYLGVFVLLIKPSDAVCVIKRFFLGAGFSIIYSALLVKTNRIYRIFKSARRTTRRPAYISPRSQLVFASVLAAVQVVVFTIWVVVEPFGSRKSQQDGDPPKVILKCKWSESSLLISLTYNMLLIIVCTIYAVLTRKIPSSFNESKFIGFTMYTTCIIWLSFCPVYFGLKSSYEIQITTLCAAVILNATVALVCLFGPKLYIILIHPTKNIRKSTTERARFSYAASKHKTETVDTENLVGPPSRSRKSSTTSPLPNGHNRKQQYELQDKAIPEEVDSASQMVLAKAVAEIQKETVISIGKEEVEISNTRESKREPSIEHLPFVDESEGSSSVLVNSDPLDMYSLKASQMINSAECLAANEKAAHDRIVISPGRGTNGDSGIYTSDQEKTTPDKETKTWQDEPAEGEELPERLI